MYPFPNFEPVCCSMSGSSYCFLTCIQIYQVMGKVIWYSHLLKNFLHFIVIHTVKGFNRVIEVEVDFSPLEFPCFFYDPVNVGNLISGSSAFSKPSLYIWKFLVHVLLKPSLKDFVHYLVSVWNECNYVVVWTFSGSVPFWDWNEYWLFLVLRPLLSFLNLLAYCNILTGSSFRILNSSAGILSPLLVLLAVMLPS